MKMRMVCVIALLCTVLLNEPILCCKRLISCYPDCTRIRDVCIYIPEGSRIIQISPMVTTIKVLGHGNVSRSVIHAWSYDQCVRLSETYPQLDIVYNDSTCLSTATTSVATTSVRPKPARTSTKSSTADGIIEHSSDTPTLISRSEPCSVTPTLISPSEPRTEETVASPTTEVDSPTSPSVRSTSRVHSQTHTTDEKPTSDTKVISLFTSGQPPQWISTHESTNSQPVVPASPSFKPVATQIIDENDSCECSTTIIILGSFLGIFGIVIVTLFVIYVRKRIFTNNDKEFELFDRSKIYTVYKYALITISTLCGITVSVFVSVKIYVTIKIKIRRAPTKHSQVQLIHEPIELSTISVLPPLTSTPMSSSCPALMSPVSTTAPSFITKSEYPEPPEYPVSSRTRFKNRLV